MDNFIYSDKNDFIGFFRKLLFRFFLLLFNISIRNPKIRIYIFLLLNYISDTKALENSKKSFRNSKFLNYNLEVFQFEPVQYIFYLFFSDSNFQIFKLCS